jgi:dipeptidyl aminopeptidase/acylaminoacyl peptidase
MLVIRTHRPAPGRRFALLLFAIALGVAFQLLSPFGAGRASAQAGDPSARQIAFDRDGEIFKMNADGTGQTDLGPGYDPAWSPDAQKIAITYPETTETTNVYVIDADGSNRVALTDSGNDFGPAYSPDGSRIAFTSYREAEPPNGSPYRIYLMNADGTGQQKLFADSPSGLSAELQPAWSPDGQRIAFIGSSVEGGLLVSDVYVVNADGSGLMRLTTFGNIDYSNTLAWSRDGQKIAFTAHRDIQTISAEGAGVLTNLTNSGASDDGQPSYTSDGSQIVYASNNFDDDTLDGIYVMNADGTAATFTGAKGADPEWKPETVAQPTPTPSPDPSPSPSPEPTPGPSPEPSPEPSPSPTPAPCVEEVTNAVAQAIDRPGNQSRKQVRHTIYVRNTSGRALNGLVHFVFDGLPASVDGDKNTTFFRTRCAEPLGRKYTTVGVGLNELVWQPGQVIKLEVDFFNPEREQINYNLRIYTGPGYP